MENISDFCSHRRSWAYYSESVLSPGVETFPAVPCSSWEAFQNNTCTQQNNGIKALMGIDSDHRLTGNYYLQTNAKEPFNQGENGTFYEGI